MHSKIASALNLQHNPVAIIWADEKPGSALQFKEGKWGCVMFMFASAAKGKTTVFDRETYGCWGGGVGLGFGNQYVKFPGSMECFYHFLSIGNEQWEQGKKVGDAVGKAGGTEILDDFMHGERYIKIPELVKKFVELLPMVDIPAQYVIFKPLEDVDLRKEKPVVIVFLADPDQLSALVILANYGREGNENVIIPYAAGCQTIGIYPYQEAKSEKPRAVVGLTDISARKNVKKQLGKDLLSFAVPFPMFQEMEGNVEGSFLQRQTWKALMEQENK
ncbi:MAG: hypothetical protein AMJ94_00760 [Deltaproteobacteria bacterium SM23_61]|nr:MAG: hypothetical protein AMJ94_00760 [Deltaproteobacteria bacterium SM23_61]